MIITKETRTVEVDTEYTTFKCETCGKESESSYEISSCEIKHAKDVCTNMGHPVTEYVFVGDQYYEDVEVVFQSSCKCGTKGIKHELYDETIVGPVAKELFDIIDRYKTTQKSPQ